MAYTPQTWADGLAGGTPISAARLGHIETGVEDADSRLARVEGSRHPAAAGVQAALERGLDTCLMATGDSTGDTSTEWFGLLGAELGARHPDYSVVFLQWVGSTLQRYSTPEYLQTGPSGERFVTVSGQALELSGTSITGDIDIRVKVRPVGSWAVGGSGQSLVSKYNSTGNQRGWNFQLSPSGRLQWIWSPDGISTTTVSASNPVPHASNTAAWVRVTFDVDNGAAGNTTKFYVSSDGVSWTQHDTDFINAGTTSIFNNTAKFSLGGFGDPPSQSFAGDFFWVEVRNGIDGYHVVSPLPSAYELKDAVSADLAVWGGSPTILMVNGSEGGQNIAYFDNATRRPKVFFDCGQQLLFLSTSHNEGRPVGPGVFPRYKTFIDNIRAILPYCPIVGVTQNPQTLGDGSATSAGSIQQHARRTARLTGFYNSLGGVWGLDTFQAFGDLGVELNADGLHPSAAGSAVWAQYLHDTLFY